MLALEINNPITDDVVVPITNEAEQAVLAAMLFEWGQVDTVRGYLKPDDFFSPRHKLIYEAMLAVYDADNAITPVLIIEHLKSAGMLDRAGGGAYISTFYDGHVRFSQIESLLPHIRKIKEASIQRRIIHLSNSLSSQAQDKEPVVQMIASAQRELQELSNQSVVRRTDTIGDVVTEVLSQIERIQETGEAPGLRTGFPDLDRIIHGFQPGLLYTLAAASKEGKTTLALQTALRASRDRRNGQPVIGILSLEMPKDKIVLRLLQLSSAVSDASIYGKMTANDWRALNAGAEEVSGLRVKVADPDRGVVEEVGAFIEELRRDFGRVDLLIIDFIQLLKSDEAGYDKRNRANQIDTIAYALKKAAQRYALPVIALAQITRDASKRTDRSADDLRDSDGIKQASDCILMLTCKDLELKTADAPLIPYRLEVVANRYGRVGGFPIQFSTEIGAFSEVIQ